MIKKPAEKGFSMPKISVVVTTFNRKKQLTELLNSVLSSNYPKEKMEIIVVDDASNDGTNDFVKKNFPEVKLIRNQKEQLTSESRNTGIRYSNTDLIFVIDDDNILNSECIKILTETMMQNESIGILMPAMCYDSGLFCNSIRRNMTTSITSFLTIPGNNLVETVDCPNAFMLRKKVLDKVGLFDSKKFPIHYEEADLGQRIRNAGYRICCQTKAKTFHHPKTTNPHLDSRAINLPLRSYFTGRNRIIFHKLHSKIWEFLPFLLFFYPIIVFYYLYMIVRYAEDNPERKELLLAFLKGNADGLKFMVFGDLPDKKQPY